MATQRIKLGTHKLPNEVRFCIKHGVDTRTHKVEVAVKISHPKLNDFLKNAKQCAGGCGTAAVVLALATGVGAAAAWAGFKTCFVACLKAKTTATIAKKTKISFETNHIRSSWSKH